MRRMGIGLGVGINRSNYAQGIFNAYSARVVTDGGVVEGGACVDAVSSLLQSASLLLIPSGYKGGKLYSQIPTNGNGDLTWTRGSDAFRTNASGLIQRVPWNLTSYSEMFSDASWTKTNATISANTTTSPNGTVTADTLIATASTGKHLLQATSHIAGTFTTSIYAKKGTNNFLQIFNGYSGQAYANFDLNNGVLGTIGSVATATIQNIGDGWYRCTLTITSPSPSSFRFTLITSSTAVFDESWIANGTESVFIWGAQLVEGTTAQTYLPTTDRLNFPRLSYMYGSCPSVLLEPQRTNLLTWSDDFSNAAWTKISSTVSTNSTTSPDGSTNADTFSANGTTAVHGLFRAQSVTSATPYTFTIYAKANTGRYLLVRNMSSATVVRYGIAVDLQNGTVTQTSSTATAPSGTSNSVTSVGSGWYRISLTMNSVDTSYGVIVESSNTGTPTLDAFLDYSYSGTESYYVYGAQLEAGAYPTTYIPTTSATATRVADSFSRNNIYTNGLISASGGTWFVELRGNVAYTRDSGGFGISLANNNTTYDFGFLILTNTGGAQRISILKRVSGIGTSIYTTTTDTTKIAIKWNGSTADVFANGTKVVSATSFTTTQMELLTANILDTPKFIQQMALFPTPLSDTDCTTLTTL